MPDARGQEDADIPAAELLRHGAVQPRGERGEHGGGLALDQHGELIVAEAGGERAAPGGLLDAARRLDQQRIGGARAEGLVHAAEPVEIDQHEAAGLAPRRQQPLDQGGAVGDAGERVLAALAAGFLLGFRDAGQAVALGLHAAPTGEHALHGRFDGVGDLAAAQRLADEVGGADAHRFRGIVDRGMAGDEDDLRPDAAVRRVDAAGEAEPVLARHADVADDDAEIAAFGDDPRRDLRRGREADLVAAPAERLADLLEHHRLVVDDEHAEAGSIVGRGIQEGGRHGGVLRQTGSRAGTRPVWR